MWPRTTILDSTVLTVVFLTLSEIDNEGVIEPDTDAPQEMGDENVEVSLMTYFLLAVLWLFYIFLTGKAQVESSLT